MMWNVKLNWIISLTRYQLEKRGLLNVRKCWKFDYKSLKNFSFAVFDAWSKFQAGIASGNLIDLGHYDQCVDFRHKPSDLSVGEIQGQHCTIFYRASVNASSDGDGSGIFNWPDMWAFIAKILNNSWNIFEEVQGCVTKI